LQNHSMHIVCGDTQKRAKINESFQDTVKQSNYRREY
jgi:hypothetical protein